jgi:hypothetical protein
MVNKLATILLLVLLLPLVCRGQERNGPEDWLRQASVSLDRTESYTAVFHKQERVKGWLKTEEIVYLKFKKPFKVYMKWIEDPGKGREILYVDGWNDNRILVRDPGFLGVVIMNLRPQGPLAMKGSRHPITEAGLEHLVKMFGDNIRKGLRSKELECRRGTEGMVYGRKTQSLELVFPRDPPVEGLRISSFKGTGFVRSHEIDGKFKEKANSFAFLPKSVSHSSEGFYIVAQISKFFPQMANMGIHGPIIPFVGISPYPVQKVRASLNTAPFGGKLHKKFELG